MKPINIINILRAYIPDISPESKMFLLRLMLLKQGREVLIGNDAVNNELKISKNMHRKAKDSLVRGGWIECSKHRGGNSQFITSYKFTPKLIALAKSKMEGGEPLHRLLIIQLLLPDSANALIENMRLSLSNRLLLAVLVLNANYPGVVSGMSYGRLTKMTGMRLDRLKSQLQKFMHLGLVTKHVRGISRNQLFDHRGCSGFFYLNLCLIDESHQIPFTIAIDSKSTVFFIMLRVLAERIAGDNQFESLQIKDERFVEKLKVLLSKFEIGRESDLFQISTSSWIEFSEIILSLSKLSGAADFISALANNVASEIWLNPKQSVQEIVKNVLPLNGNSNIETPDSYSAVNDIFTKLLLSYISVNNKLFNKIIEKAFGKAPLFDHYVFISNRGFCVLKLFGGTVEELQEKFILPTLKPEAGSGEPNEVIHGYSWYNTVNDTVAEAFGLKPLINKDRFKVE